MKCTLSGFSKKGSPNDKPHMFNPVLSFSSQFLSFRLRSFYVTSTYLNYKNCSYTLFIRKCVKTLNLNQH